MKSKKIVMNETEMPNRWYNLAADLPFELQPPLHPGTLQPIGPDDLSPLFPMELILQEVSRERFIPIPDEVMDILSLWRPTPLVRAEKFEKAIGTRCRIYFKNESVSPPGSHKPNTAVAQAYYNHREGIRTITTETGAGQWGSALSFACNFFGIDCKVFMVRVSYESKPYRKSMINLWGADITASPSNETESGRKILVQDPGSPGSLGIAISEAVELAAKDEKTKYSLGSVLNHVLLHQTVIGEEAIRQMRIAEDYPDVVIGCVGGGSNFAGLAFPFIREKLGGRDIKFVAAEPAACPTLTRGSFNYDFGDTARLTPLLPMFSLGHDFMPAKIHAGGLRYHGMSPLVSALVKNRMILPKAYDQETCFESALLFARSEGIIPAPESSHAIRATIDEALQADAKGQEKVILFNLSGHGHFDMSAYDAFLNSDLMSSELNENDLKRNLASLEELPTIA